LRSDFEAIHGGLPIRLSVRVPATYGRTCPNGRRLEELAREFDPTAQLISDRVKQAEQYAGKAIEGTTSVEREKLARLWRENHRPRKDRDIPA